MSVTTNSSGDKTATTATGGSLMEQAAQLDVFVRQAGADGVSLDAVERHTFDFMLRIGRTAIDQFLSLQGGGDLGPSVRTEAGKTLHRSDEPVRRDVRTVFGRHTFDAFVCSPGPHLKIEVRPLDARMCLPGSARTCSKNSRSSSVSSRRSDCRGRRCRPRCGRTSASINCRTSTIAWDYRPMSIWNSSRYRQRPTRVNFQC